MTKHKWKIVYAKEFDKAFEKLDKQIQGKITGYLEAVLDLEDPKIKGKQLAYNQDERWAYRIGSYRVLVELDEDSLIILAVKVGHRSTVYKQKR